MPTKEAQLDAKAALVRLFIDQEIPDVTAWNVDPNIMMDSLILLGDFFTDTDDNVTTLQGQVAALQAATVGEWIVDAGSPLQISSSQFKLSGDRRPDFGMAQRVRVQLGSSKVIVVVQGVTYDNVDTAVNVLPAVLTPSLNQVERGLVRFSMPQVQLSDLFFDVATQVELDAAVASLNAGIAAAAAASVAKAGSTMTGLLILSGDPAAATGAATKQYVDAKAPKTPQFLTLAADAGLDNERVFTPRDGLVKTDAGAGAAYTLDWNPLDPSLAWLRDDFFSGDSQVAGSGQPGPNGDAPYGNLSWTRYNLGTTTGANVRGSAGSIPHFGILELLTPGTNGSGVALALQTPTQEGSLGPIGTYGASTWDSYWVFKLAQATSMSVRIGYVLVTGPNDDPATDGFWLRFDTNAGDSAFRIESRAGGVSTVHGTTYPVDANWHKLRIRTMAGAGTIGFTLDANAEITINTNVPTVALCPFASVKARSGSARSLFLDLFTFSMRGLAR